MSAVHLGFHHLLCDVLEFNYATVKRNNVAAKAMHPTTNIF